MIVVDDANDVAAQSHNSNCCCDDDDDDVVADDAEHVRVVELYADSSVGLNAVDDDDDIVVVQIVEIDFDIADAVAADLADVDVVEASDWNCLKWR